MSYCRPAGFSDDEDEDEFEFSTDNDNCKREKVNLDEMPQSKESLFYSALVDVDLETMKAMLADGFHVDQPLSGGWSPLMYACSLGSFPVVEFLIDAKANVNFSKELFTSLMALCKSRSTTEDDLLNCLNLLLNCGANINATDRNACTALMYACSSGHIRLVRKLVDCKCDVNIQDTEGWSALFYAVNDGQEDIIPILLGGKARLDLIDKRRRTAFHLALQKGYESIAKLVCSQKEKRKIQENEENVAISEKSIKDPVEDLIDQLPRTNAKSISGFPSDVNRLLWAMGLGNFCKMFTTKNIQLNEFLLITDERLKTLGVRFSVHRQRILNSIRKFHLHQWNKASLGIKPRNEQMDVEDAVRLMCNVTKHLHILNATMNYVRDHQPLPINPEVFKVCDNVVHQLNLISGELSVIQDFAAGLKLKERIEPVDLIKQKPKSRSCCMPLLALTVVIGVLLVKNKYVIFH